MAKSVDYQDYLIESLKDPEEAAAYLNAALEENDIDLFLVALKKVVQAQGGVGKVAEKTHRGRNSLYKTLSKTGNPYLKSTSDILKAIGMHFSIEVYT